MGIIFLIVFGALVGWVASMVMGTNGQQGGFMNVVIGIVGSVLGSWLFGALGWSGALGFNLHSFLVALVGACVLLAIVKAIRR